PICSATQVSSKPSSSASMMSWRFSSQDSAVVALRRVDWQNSPNLMGPPLATVGHYTGLAEADQVRLGKGYRTRLERLIGRICRGMIQHLVTANRDLEILAG